MIFLNHLSDCVYVYGKFVVFKRIYILLNAVNYFFLWKLVINKVNQYFIIWLKNFDYLNCDVFI